MPHYHFHLHHGVEVHDHEGRQLDDLDAAVAVAIESARALIAADVVDRGEVTLGHRIDVEDGDGRLLQTIRFGDAIRIIP